MKGIRIIAAVFFAVLLGLLPEQGEAAPGDISTVVGGGVAATTLLTPYGVAVDAVGNVYIADSGQNRVLKWGVATGAVSVVAGNGTTSYSGDGGQADQAGLKDPEAVAVDGAGDLYIADTGHYCVRKVAAGTGIISTVAGNGTRPPSGYTGDGGPATSATMRLPQSLALDSAGNLYIADWSGNSIRKVAAGTGIISTVTNLVPPQGYFGPTGPTGVAVDGDGNLYIVDNANHRVWKMAGGTGSKVSVAGTGVAGYNGDGGLAKDAQLNQPFGITVDGAGNLYITELESRIRKVDAVTGIISVVAGTGQEAYSGDGGPAIDAALQRPRGVALDISGNMFIADTGNNRIRKVRGNDPPVVTVAPDGGTYSAAVSVVLSADRVALIYYTTDGTQPTIYSSTYDEVPISISSTTTLKYFARDIAGNQSAMLSESYAIVPGAPTGVSATAGVGKATVSFTPPGFTGGTITSYTVTSTPGGITATGSASPITVNGLSAGTSYRFTVSAANATGSGPASAASNSVVPTAPPNYALTLAFAGTGGGSVNGGMSCTSGSTCAASQFSPGTVVTLLASPDANSTFGGWSGCNTVSGNNCSVTMSAAKTVTSTFVAAPKAKILGGASYSLLSSAYAAAATGAVIQARSVLFNDGILTLNLPKTVKLIGGYDTLFSASPGRATIQGKLQIRSGTVRVDGVALR